jgi:hypothetical protein
VHGETDPRTRREETRIETTTEQERHTNYRLLITSRRIIPVTLICSHLLATRQRRGKVIMLTPPRGSKVIIMPVRSHC